MLKLKAGEKSLCSSNGACFDFGIERELNNVGPYCLSGKCFGDENGKWCIKYTIELKC